MSDLLNALIEMQSNEPYLIREGNLRIDLQFATEKKFTLSSLTSNCEEDIVIQDNVKELNIITLKSIVDSLSSYQLEKNETIVAYINFGMEGQIQKYQMDYLIRFTSEEEYKHSLSRLVHKIIPKGYVEVKVGNVDPTQPDRKKGGVRFVDFDWYPSTEDRHIADCNYYSLVTRLPKRLDWNSTVHLIPEEGCLLDVRVIPTVRFYRS